MWSIVAGAQSVHQRPVHWGVLRAAAAGEDWRTHQDDRVHAVLESSRRQPTEQSPCSTRIKQTSTNLAESMQY
jgi:hypothetical protein